MVYYKSRLHGKGDNVNHLLYLILSTFGVLISVGALLHSLVFIFSIWYQESVLMVLLPFSYVLMITSTYSSALLSVMLAVVRTLNIIQPVRRIDTVLLLVCIGAYWIIWLLVASVDSYYWSSKAAKGSFQAHYYYSFLNMAGVNGVINLLNDKGMLASYIAENHTIVLPVLIWVIPCVIPSFICLVCTLVQISLLWWRRVPTTNSAVHSKVTITIILLTGVFFICNTISFTVCMTMVYEEWKAGYKLWLSLYFATSMTAFINAISNPVILITRGQRLRRYVGQLVRSAGGARPAKRVNLNGRKNNIKVPGLFRTKEENISSIGNIEAKGETIELI